MWRVSSEWNAYYRLCLNRLTNCSRQAGSYEHSCFVILCVETRWSGRGRIPILACCDWQPDGRCDAPKVAIWQPNARFSPN